MAIMKYREIMLSDSLYISYLSQYLKKLLSQFL